MDMNACIFHTDYPTKIQKTDIGEPIPVPDPEAETADTDVTESNEMLVN